MRGLYAQYQASGDKNMLLEASAAATDLSHIKRILCTLHPSKLKMITDGNIPDSHIVFLDEIFKCGDGILNSLLTALNERVYTNEGQTVPIPVISFFSESNEIPNFNDSTQAILKPLYDRFELKVLTEYVQEKDNRMRVLARKQRGSQATPVTTITLTELEAMQLEVESVTVPDKINELMDDVLCELRRAEIHVSDRKYFGFTPIVRAKEYLDGNTEVSPRDLLILRHYFWNTPAEIPTVGKILTDLCENPLGAEIDRILSMVNEGRELMEETMAQLEAEHADERGKIKPYVVFSKELFRIYLELANLRNNDLGDAELDALTKAENELEKMLTEAAEAAKAANTAAIPLSEQKRLNI